MHSIFCLGESTFDITFAGDQPVSGYPGGSVCNTAVSLGRLQRPVSLLSRLGSDPLAELTRQFLASNGVATELVARYEGNSRLALAFLDDEKKATYRFYAPDPSLLPDPLFPPFHQNDIVLYGSTFALQEKNQAYLARMFAGVHDAGGHMVYDPNLRPAFLAENPGTTHIVERNLKQADLVKASDEDLELLWGCTDFTSAAQRMLALSPGAILVYTMGPKGAAVCLPDGRTLHRPSLPVRPVSTIGAGDTFSAGLLYGLSRPDVMGTHWRELPLGHWEKIIDQAHAMAAAVCASEESCLPKGLSFA